MCVCVFVCVFAFVLIRVRVFALVDSHPPGRLGHAGPALAPP